MIRCCCTYRVDAFSPLSLRRIDHHIYWRWPGHHVPLVEREAWPSHSRSHSHSPSHSYPARPGVHASHIQDIFGGQGMNGGGREVVMGGGGGEALVAGEPLGVEWRLTWTLVVVLARSETVALAPAAVWEWKLSNLPAAAVSMASTFPISSPGFADSSWPGGQLVVAQAR